jgi:MFS transporter, DHA1 family, multidrug resistance protein
MPRSDETTARAADERRATGTAATAAALFLSFIDVAALLPTVAPHVASLGAGPAAVGLAVGAYSATNLPANILGGVLIDRVGRRRLTIIGFLLAAGAVLGYATATTVTAFIVIRLLHGVAGGILVTAIFALAGDRTRAGRAGRSFGRFGALIGGAWVVGPAAAGIVRQTAGTTVVFQAVAVLLVLGAGIVWLRVRDVAVVDPRTDPSSDPSVVGDAAPIDPGRAMRELAARPAVRRALIATMLWMSSVGILAAFLPDAAEDLGAPASAVGGLFTAYAIVAALMMLSPLAGRVDRRGADGMIAAGLALIGMALLAMMTATSLEQLLLASALFGGGYGLIFPSVTGAISLAASTATRGRAFGLFNAAFSVGLAVGPPVAGALAERYVALDPFLPAAVLMLVTSAGVAVAGRRDRRARSSDAAA